LFNRTVLPAIAVIAAALLAMAAAPTDASALALPSGETCPAQKNPRASEHDQEQALRCVVDRVRRSGGVGGLASNRALERAAGHKAHDLANCGFTHTACGREADAWADHYGYDSGTWQWGENLATGKRRMTARAAVKAWLRSSSHRSTLLDGSFEHVGVGLKRTGRRAYWVIELGCHGC
jgi:uncharacterized protein YkwD